MRLSADKDDSAFEKWWPAYAGKCINVYLDDELVKECITADEESGYIKKNKLGVDGRPYLDRVNDCIATEELSGKVRIEII